MSTTLYHLGLPAWAYSGWNNVYFNSKPTALTNYSRVFNTVEGNTTFYHIPDKTTVSNWQQAVADTGFRLCFKFPKTITHQSRPALDELDLFLNRIKPLRQNTGPFLLQFPSTAGPDNLRRIESVIANIPDHYRIALEVRHEEFFTQPELLEPLIEKYHLGRVIMDTRPVFKGNQNHPEVTAALHQKPDLPVLGQVYNGIMFVRLLLHPDNTGNAQYLNQWVNRTSQALNKDTECYIMIHCPNNQHCPTYALDFHNRLMQKHNDQTHVPLEPLPMWPVPQQQNLL